MPGVDGDVFPIGTRLFFTQCRSREPVRYKHIRKTSSVDRCSDSVLSVYPVHLDTHNLSAMMWITFAMFMEVTVLKTIQITLPEDLLQRVDRAVRDLATTRSAFTRQAFEDALRHLRLQDMEKRDTEGYAQQSQTVDEVTVWETTQDWGDM